MADDELTPASAPETPEDAPVAASEPTPAPETPEAAAEPTPEPASAANEPAAEPAAEPTAAVVAAQSSLAEQFAETVHARLLTANYGVSAGVGVMCVARADGDLLLVFEAKEAAEALQAASAALATVPDDDTRVWRFAGSGPDLETGRARAVVRISRPASPAASSAPAETPAETPAQ